MYWPSSIHCHKTSPSIGPLLWSVMFPEFKPAANHVTGAQMNICWMNGWMKKLFCIVKSHRCSLTEFPHLWNKEVEIKESPYFLLFLLHRINQNASLPAAWEPRGWSSAPRSFLLAFHPWLPGWPWASGLALFFQSSIYRTRLTLTYRTGESGALINACKVPWYFSIKIFN